ncbi:hypothetical protein JCGZ_13582 [Jatropha curcas]|uniref:Uncharacterized protein n=1 Tax=Jatropha curcas TaxID=180498 RepID=A0A067KDJ2_JATCU|nr:hypothetical protein JCGZ_13582 [Jatropha curcas]
MHLLEIFPMLDNSIGIQLDLSRYLCWAIVEIWMCEHRVLLMPWLYNFFPSVDERTLPGGQAWRYNKICPYNNSDPVVFWHMLNDLKWNTHDKCVKRGFDTEVPDTAVVVGKLEHALGASFTFLSTSTGLPGMLSTHTVSLYRISMPGCPHVLIEDYNELSQLFKATRLKLAVMTLSDENIFISKRTTQKKSVL